MTRRSMFTVAATAMLAACSSSSGGASSAAPSASGLTAAASGVVTASALVSGTVAGANASLDASAVAAAPDASAPPPIANAKAGTDPLFSSPDAVVETFDGGSAAFVVADDGTVKAALAHPDGSPDNDGVVNLKLTPEGSTETKESLLLPDPSTHYLVGHGPKLTAAVTAVPYAVVSRNVRYDGVLHIPIGGTKALVDTGTTVAAAHVTPVVGPHGGKIERVGDDDVEMLVDPDSGEARAWLIVDGTVVPPKDRDVSIYVDDHYVDCYADQNDSFYARFEPSVSLKVEHKISVAVWAGASVHAVLWGFRPHLTVAMVRPVLDVRVVGWTATEKVKFDKNPNEPGLGWANGKEKHHSGGVAVDVTVSVNVHVGVGHHDDDDDDDHHEHHEHHDNGNHNGEGHGHGHGHGHGKH